MLPLTQIKFIAFGVAIVFAAWFGRHYTVLQYQEQIAEQRRQIAELQAKQAEQTVKIVTEYVDRVREVKVQGDAIIKEVPVYVSQTADAQCVIPAGFVRVHDQSANGVPEPARDSDASPSGVALSAVAETVAGNYGTCRETAEQLKALQDWVRETHGQEVPPN